MIHELIKQSYSEEEARLFTEYRLAQSDADVVQGACRAVLSAFPAMAHSCVPMSALWASLIRDQTQIPVHVVAGNLRLGEKLLFGANLPDKAWGEQFNTSNNEWNGHCWIIFGDKIGEISLFRTAYADSAPTWLNALILKTFGAGRGALFSSAEEMKKDDLHYEARYVLTSDQVDLCANGAVHLLRQLSN